MLWCAFCYLIHYIGEGTKAERKVSIWYARSQIQSKGAYIPKPEVNTYTFICVRTEIYFSSTFHCYI